MLEVCAADGLTSFVQSRIFLLDQLALNINFKFGCFQDNCHEFFTLRLVSSQTFFVRFVILLPVHAAELVANWQVVKFLSDDVLICDSNTYKHCCRL